MARTVLSASLAAKERRGREERQTLRALKRGARGVRLLRDGIRAQTRRGGVRHRRERGRERLRDGRVLDAGDARRVRARARAAAALDAHRLRRRRQRVETRRVVVRGERVAKRLENVREERRRRAFGAQERANVHVARRVHHGADAGAGFAANAERTGHAAETTAAAGCSGAEAEACAV